MQINLNYFQKKYDIRKRICHFLVVKVYFVLLGGVFEFVNQDSGAHLIQILAGDSSVQAISGEEAA